MKLMGNRKVVWEGRSAMGGPIPIGIILFTIFDSHKTLICWFA